MKNKKAISPISFFGPIIKFAIIKQCETTIEGFENFQKRSMRNRTQILGANGSLLLSVPLKKGKNQSAIKDVKIAYEDDWQRDQVMTIKSAYGSAPYFDYYISDIERIYNSKHLYLIDLFEEQYQWLQKKLDLPDLIYSTTFEKQYSDTIDLRSKSIPLTYEIPKYFQVFEDKFGFTSNLSIIDLIFNLGPESKMILNKTKIVF